MKKKLFCIILSLAMIVTMMPAMAMTSYAADKEPASGFSVSNFIIVEGWSMDELHPTFKFTYAPSTHKDHAEFYQGYYTYFFMGRHDSDSFPVSGDYKFQTNDKGTLWLILEAPEGSYFTSGFTEEGYTLRHDVNHGINCEIYKIVSRYNKNMTGTDISKDGKYSLLVAEDSIDKINNGDYSDVRYQAYEFNAYVFSQWWVLDSIVNTWSGDVWWDQYNKYFDYEFQDDGSLHITLTHDLTVPNGEDNEQNHNLTIPKGKNVVLDLNGYKIDRGLANSEYTENGNVITVAEDAELTITDSSEEKTGLITGGNNNSDGGAIINYGECTIENVTIAGNKAAHNGGAIFNHGNLTLKNATICNNFAGNEGGGVYNLDKAMPTLNLEGKVKIRDNEADVANSNMNLSEYVSLNILDSMKDAGIAVSSLMEPLHVNFSEAAKGIKFSQIFYLEGSPDYYLDVNEDGYMEVCSVPEGYSGIAVPPVEGGNVTSSKQYSQSGKYVKLTAKAESGYKFDSFVFYDAEGNIVPVKLIWMGDSEYLFKAPEKSVIVKAQFKTKSKKAAIRDAVQIAVGAVTVAAVTTTVANAAAKLFKPILSNIENQLADIFKPINIFGTNGLLTKTLKAINIFGEGGFLSKVFSQRNSEA